VNVGAGGSIPDLGVSGTLELGRFFRWRVESLTPEPKLPNGSTAGHTKRISKARVYVRESVRVKINGRAIGRYWTPYRRERAPRSHRTGAFRAPQHRRGRGMGHGCGGCFAGF
jgi:hypothetical protein